MPAPIRTAWHNRPGWSEYKAPRGGGGKHWGYDSYCLPRTTIYAISTGTVVAKGYAAGGYGHYIDVFYPGMNVRQREAHMAEASGLRVGAQVTAGSALGRVGRTGNAKNIYWIRDGVLLEHDHSQAWTGNTTNGDNNVDPRNYWGGTAGGDITPVTDSKGMTDMLYWMHPNQTYIALDPARGEYRALSQQELLHVLALEAKGLLTIHKPDEAGWEETLIPLRGVSRWQPQPLSENATPIDPVAFAAALAPLLKVGITAAEVDAALADNFAAIPDAVRQNIKNAL